MKMNSVQLGIATGSGTLLSVFGQLGLHDAVRTAVLAAIGAAVSFLVSLVLQRLLRRKYHPDRHAGRGSLQRIIRRRKDS